MRRIGISTQQRSVSEVFENFYCPPPFPHRGILITGLHPHSEIVERQQLFNSKHYEEKKKAAKNVEENSALPQPFFLEALGPLFACKAHSVSLFFKKSQVM